MEASQTQMINPPKEQTKMVDPQKKGQKMYKLFVLQPFNVGSIEYGSNGSVIRDTTRLAKVGDIVEVSRQQAKDLCQPIYGGFAFSGERYVKDKDCPRHNLTRARLATPADLVKQDPITPIEDDVFGTEED